MGSQRRPFVFVLAAFAGGLAFTFSCSEPTSPRAVRLLDTDATFSVETIAENKCSSGRNATNGMCPAMSNLIDSIIGAINTVPGAQCTVMKNVLGRLKTEYRIRTFSAESIYLNGEWKTVYEYMSWLSDTSSWTVNGVEGARIDYIYLNTDSLRVKEMTTDLGWSRAQAFEFLMKHGYGHGHAGVGVANGGDSIASSYGAYCKNASSNAPPEPAAKKPPPDECSLGPLTRLRSDAKDEVLPNYSACEGGQAPLPPTGGNSRGENGYQVCYKHWRVEITFHNIQGLWVVYKVEELYLGTTCWLNGSMT